MYPRARRVTVGATTHVEPEHARGLWRIDEASDSVGHGHPGHADARPVARVAVDGARGGEHAGVAGDGQAGVERVAVHAHLLHLRSAASCMCARMNQSVDGVRAYAPPSLPTHPPSI